MKPKSELFVYQAWKLRAALLLFALVGLLGGWQLYGLGQRDAAAELQRLRAERQRLEARLAEMDAENGELVRRLAVLERSQQVDRQAHAALRQDRAALEAEIQSLREELGFFRGIMSPETARAGLRAQGFMVEPTGADNRYRFRMVMVQVKKNDRVARGVVRLTVEGRQAGELKQLPLQAISTTGRKEIKYRFRYFQPMEGEWRLPADFVPERVNVKALAVPPSRTPLEWTFEWPADGGSRPRED
ncbi:hypothetical protein QVG61_11665 [Thiohalobacter sp. IOR34]|uniref:DUF6776 family protein n=1 Tax=Thiohalobacter sp. IOR34 TaxID=3057176 RepID=UPI0025B19645|nr:DUF6776 family protein [Thiohalobacter sp. IOR34]WJW75135.1 hypothetical protein QVG61_11665 [Thiohalobacter sp. IOR34]